MTEDEVKSLPYMKAPCGNCPFRKDVMKGWLGADRAREIVECDNFVCHKKNQMQCAGHMHVARTNIFVTLVINLYKIVPPIKNVGVLFESSEDFINHHDPKS